MLLYRSVSAQPRSGTPQGTPNVVRSQSPIINPRPQGTQYILR